MIKQKLYWERFRPKKIQNLILLDRIKKLVLEEDGELRIINNMIFTGSWGLGKTSLASIYADSFLSMRVNASSETSVDNLREKVLEFCQSMGDIFDNRRRDIKIVVLEEFDGVSRQYQDALKVFLESQVENVRFIATTNNISKIDGGVLDRFTIVDFNPQNSEEEQFLINGYVSRANAIVKKENIPVSEEELKKLVTNCFPSFRRVLDNLQLISLVGNTNVQAGNSTVHDLYKLIVEPISVETTYEYIMSNWADKAEVVINQLGRPFAKWLMQMHPDKINAMPKTFPLVSTYSSRLKDMTDPVVHILALILELQKIFTK